MRKEINGEIGFSDGELLGYHRGIEETTVEIKAWNDKTIVVTFSSVEGVEDLGIGDIAGFFQDDSQTPFLDRVLREVYEVPPNKHPYFSFQFVDLDGNSRLEIIAESVSIR